MEPAGVAVPSFLRAGRDGHLQREAGTSRLGKQRRFGECLEMGWSREGTRRPEPRGPEHWGPGGL